MTTTRVPASPCPRCGALNDAATGNGTPQPGDLSICTTCVTVCQYGPHLALELVTDRRIINHPQVTAMVTAVRLMKAGQ